MEKTRLKCSNCGAEFIRDIWHPRKTVCSQRCSSIVARSKLDPVLTRRRSKEYRENRWFGGNREAVLIRDGNRCTQCGSVKGISVHHIDGKGRGYKGVINNAMSNLVTLCCKCHQDTHGKQRAKCNKKQYILGVANYWEKSDREIARLLGISHPTVASVRKLLAEKILNGGSAFSIDPR